MASFDNPLVELRNAQTRAIAEFERIQLKAHAKHAASCAIANNSEIHDIFSNVFDGPSFVPGAFDVKCALLFGPAVGHPTRFAGADATTFPARVVVSQYQVVVGHEHARETNEEILTKIADAIEGRGLTECAIGNNSCSCGKPVARSCAHNTPNRTYGYIVKGNTVEFYHGEITFKNIQPINVFTTHDEKIGITRGKWIAETIINFEIDNYGNLFHAESGLYLIFNRAPFPTAAFRFLLFNSKQIFPYNKRAKGYWDVPANMTLSNYSNAATESAFFIQAGSIVPQNAAAIFAHLHKMRDALQTRVSVPPPIAASQRAIEYDAQHQQIMLMRAEIAALNETIAAQQMKLDISAAIIDKFKETQKILAGILPVDTN